VAVFICAAVHVRMSPNPVPTINNLDQTTDWFNSIERCFVSFLGVH